MPAPTQCSVSGTMRDAGGNALSGVTIDFAVNRPFVHTTDNSLICNYKVTATSAANGTWSVNVVETATDSVTMGVTITFPLGSNASNGIQTYQVTIPNQASATLASLITGQ